MCRIITLNKVGSVCCESVYLIDGDGRMHGVGIALKSVFALYLNGYIVCVRKRMEFDLYITFYIRSYCNFIYLSKCSAFE